MPTDVGLDTAIANAIDFFAASREPHALLWLDVMHRRFGVEAFADALQRFDQALTGQPEQLPILRVFRRIADPENPLRAEDLQAVSHPSDLIVAYALYCDRTALPPVYPKALYRAATEGGYYLTHALLAWVLIQENGYELALPDGFIDEVYSATAAIVNNDPTIVSDLRLEAAAFLYLAGQGARIDDVFVDRVLQSQKDDGGWGGSRAGQEGSDWHSTILGLLLLLQVKFPADCDEPIAICHRR